MPRPTAIPPLIEKALEIAEQYFIQAGVEDSIDQLTRYRQGVMADLPEAALNVASIISAQMHGRMGKELGMDALITGYVAGLEKPLRTDGKTRKYEDLAAGLIQQCALAAINLKPKAKSRIPGE